MDNLARCAMLAKRDGKSYGQWMAIHGEKEIKKKKVIPEGWKPCEYCGKMFRAGQHKRFCEIECRTRAYYENNREKILENLKAAQKRFREKKAEKNL